VRLKTEGNRCAPDRPSWLRARALLGFVMLVSMAWPVWPQDKPVDLTDRSLEDLMNIEVTSVSKKEQKLSHVASAIFVITSEDIRRSGATKIPDLLRMVPGLNVAQINGTAWEISSRGFNSQFANKLLVLIDGRTVYSPLFSGVYWDVQDVPLEDIDRIEVIRGPGATVWGANAVNGVINIITKSAKDNEGGFLTAGSGTYESGFGVAQYGGKFSPGTSYRFFVKGFDDTSLPSLEGADGHDAFDLLHGGFRIDSTLSDRDSLTVQGDLYEGHEGEVVPITTLTPPSTQALALTTKVLGGNVLERWDHTFSPNSETSLLAYFDNTQREAVISGESVNTFDIDFQHHVGWGSRQDFVWGLGYRYLSYATTPSLTISFTPTSKTEQLFTSFLQDEITLNPNRVYLTVGAKFEHNDFTGFVFEPSVRIAWNVADNHTLWAGYSRAARTPSPADTAIRISFAAFPGPDGLPALLTVLGNPHELNENLDSFEAGYRTQLRSNISLDVAGFYNRYDDLENSEPGTPFVELNPPPPHINVPTLLANNMFGETQGVEGEMNWKATSRWTLSPGYTFERIHLHATPTSHDTTSVLTAEGSSPHVQAQIRSNLALPRGFEWDSSVYFVGRLPAEQVPSYTRLDSGITWRTSEHIALSLVGQNLLKDRHLEATSPSVASNFVKRTAYAKFTWRF
jgi:iron complex outermembrane recepter protein